jgi:hypothetical protein
MRILTLVLLDIEYTINDFYIQECEGLLLYALLPLAALSSKVTMYSLCRTHARVDGYGWWARHTSDNVQRPNDR